MNNKKFKGYVLLIIIGVILFVAGIVLMINFEEPQGVMKSLPFVCIGVGLGALSGGIGAVISFHLMQKNPSMAKQKEIDIKDERNINITNKAKAKVFNYTWMLFSALLIFLAMMEIKLSIIVVFIGAYLSIIILYIYLLNKYSKEM